MNPSLWKGPKFYKRCYKINSFFLKPHFDPKYNFFFKQNICKMWWCQLCLQGSTHVRVRRLRVQIRDSLERGGCWNQGSVLTHLFVHTLQILLAECVERHRLGHAGLAFPPCGARWARLFVALAGVRKLIFIQDVVLVRLHNPATKQNTQPNSTSFKAHILLSKILICFVVVRARVKSFLNTRTFPVLLTLVTKVTFKKPWREIFNKAQYISFNNLQYRGPNLIGI